jgi:hypothetical protein
MSSTPQSIPLTRRIEGRVAIAVGVLVAIAVAVTLIAVTSPNNPTLRTSTGTPHANVGSTPQTQHLGQRQLGRTVVKVPGSSAAVGNTASSPTVQPNPDQQGITSHNQELLRKVLPGWREGELPGWLIRP